jgi:hypothetical protein
MVYTAYKKSGQYYDLKIYLLSWDLFLAQKRILTFDTMVNIKHFSHLIIHKFHIIFIFKYIMIMD